MATDHDPPVISLASAPGQGESWDRPKWMVYLWGAFELAFITNPWQISSSVRVAVLRRFGAQIGSDVVFRPRTRVRFPWKLQIGDDCWIGEGVWFHNQDRIVIGKNVVISQETLLTTGSHAHRRDMALLTRPIEVEDGAWITSRCMILGGSVIGKSALVSPMSLVNGLVAAGTVVRGNPAVVVANRFDSQMGR